VIRDELPGTAIIVLSAHVEVDEAMELLAGGQGLGYLLKSRVTDVTEFLDTVERITAGASVVDPSLVQELVGRAGGVIRSTSCRRGSARCSP
jgi:DNA-binding NarL/FixJ family response regulator